jgi:hypothetical protein
MSQAVTVRTGKVGKIGLRLAKKDHRFFGLANGKILTEGDDADDVWRRLHDEAGKGNSKYFGFDGARNRFLHFFPNGFHSAGYEDGERNYKIAAKSKLGSTVPVETAATGGGFGEAILSVFRATNLLYPVEKSRLQDLLRGPDADVFIQAAAKFTLGEKKTALSEMESSLKPHDNAKWTVVTYLPFLWRPEEHMFLKPEVTKDFAERVGHPFAFHYEPRLDIAVYDSLLDLASKTANELADMGPRDRIDVQSFIWVVGDYNDETERPLP